MHYKKGATIPKWIGKARNPAHQRMMKFNVSVYVSNKTVIALKSGHHVIDVSVPKIMKKKFSPKFRDVFINCKAPTDYAIVFNWLPNVEGKPQPTAAKT